MIGSLLKCGDPAQIGGATYTRFVLPFAYSLSGIASEHSSGNCTHYKKIEDRLDGLAARREYLTAETAEVLLRGAAWFELSSHSGKFERKVIVRNGKKSLNLNVDRVLLVLFEFRNCDFSDSDLLRNGFLVVDLSFAVPVPGVVPDLADLLHVNERFRYFREPWEGHVTKTMRDFWKPGNPGINIADGDLRSDGADSDSRTEEPKPVVRRENDAWNPEVSDPEYDWWNQLLKFPIDVEGIRDMRSLSVIDKRNAWPDNRAFVWTCAVVEGGSGGMRLRKGQKRLGELSLNEKGYGTWGRLLNVDGPSDLGLRKFEIDWTDQRTYKRWEEWGTFYGFCSHAGAAAMGPTGDVAFQEHFRQMYFDQILLLLYVKVTLFRFSARLSQISASARKGRTDRKQWMKDFRELYWQFTLFTNLYRFPLLSNQEQSLEMYGLMRQGLEVDELFEEVQSEVQSSYGSLQQFEEFRLVKSTEWLTTFAAIAAAISILIAFLGAAIVFEPIYSGLGCIPFVSDGRECGLDARFWFFLTLLAVCAAATISALLYWKHRSLK